MGLALVHGIVEGCSGYIRVESQLGKGSTFHIYFPAIAEETVLNAQEEKEVLPRGNERILAVDDEKPIVDMYKAGLERQGYTVTVHNSSEEAFETFRNSPENFDLIITDQTMPHLSGIELAQKILQIRPDIPIILSTGYSSVVSKDKAKKFGVKRFLMKPVERKILIKAVREVLDADKS